MSVHALNKEIFDKTIQDHECAVVDFWASWCGPCLVMAPILEELSEKHPDIFFGKVNIEEEPELAEDFQVRSIPYLMIFRGEFVVFAQAGTQPLKALEELVLEAKKIDINELRTQLEKKPD